MTKWDKAYMQLNKTEHRPEDLAGYVTGAALAVIALAALGCFLVRGCWA